MSCNGNTSNICVDPIVATCVDYQGPLGSNTKITDECVNQNDVNEDLYAITDETITAIDVSSIVGDCITIPLGASIADIVSLLKDKVCAQDAQITALESINYADIDITGFGLTIPACIADSCANPPTTLAEWMQVIMDQRNCT